MDSKCIGFIGLGLISGSIARAVRAAHPDYRLIAFDRAGDSLVRAMQDGVINQATDKIDSSFSQCSVIILGMPVSLNIACLGRLKDLVSEDCVITDVGSVKSGIHEAAERLGLSDRFVGGHPMTGSERSGYANSSPLLMENAYYIITTSPRLPEERIEAIRSIARDIHSIPIVIDCREHDKITASISHLPHVIAFSLVNLIRTSDSRDGLMRQLAAGGFRDITRIASSSPDMWESICLENSGPVLTAIESYKSLLSAIEDAIKEKDGRYLHTFFQEARDYRDDMPSRNPGSIKPSYDIFVDIIDESGAIATIATILASNNISIKNISIIHNREFEDGGLRIEFYDSDSVERACAILAKFSYVIHRR